MNELYNSYPLLVIGCARSGTLYASTVWQALGLDVRHERPTPPNGVLGRDGICSWLMTVDDLRPPYGPSAHGLSFDFIIHQVRDPIKTISSVAQWVFKGKHSWKYVERNLPGFSTGMPDHSQLCGSRELLVLSAMRYWVGWNTLAEEKANISVKVENLVQELPGICDLMGISPLLEQDISDIPTSINRRRNYIREELWEVSWAEMEAIDAALCEEVRHLASRYEYALAD